MQNNVIPVVFCFDKRIILGASVAIQSLINCAKDTTTYDIRIFHSDLSFKNQKNISKLIENTRHNIGFHYINPDLFKNAPKSSGSWSEIVYYRFLIPNTLKEYDKVIYSDVDVLFKNDLFDLYNTDINDFELGAVRAENNMPNTLGHKYFKENKKDYIYWSGLLLLNNKKFREENMLDKLLFNAKKHFKELKFFDLDLMNITCQKIKPLDFKYCVLQSIYYNENFSSSRDYKYIKNVYSDNELTEAKNNPSIIHYAGHPGKPWRLKRTYFDYQEYIDKLPKELKIYTFRDLRKRLFISYKVPDNQKCSDSKSNESIFRNLIKIQKIDSHIVVNFANLIQISIKHETKFNYKEAKKYGLNTTEKRDKKLIVSLTSYPERISYTEKTINTLLQQAIKPDKLILYLSNDEFKNKENDLPASLLKLKKYGLEIRWCEYLRSYQKLIPVLRDFPDDVIVTADDDMYYETDWLENLYKAYLKNPKNIYTHRTIRIKFEKENIKPISQREALNGDFAKASYLNTLMGFSGVLYPPNSLNKEVLNIEKFKKIIPTHDDIWFWAMSVLNHTKTSVVNGYKRNTYQIEETKNTGLRTINLDNNKGMTVDSALSLITKEYPEIIKIINEGEYE